MHNASDATPTVALLNRALGERYHVGQEIGRGGMAVVYKAEDLKHGRTVALKVLKPHFAATIGRDRFLREIAVTARLDHARILPLLDSGEAGGLLYYVMPYVEGESLRARLKREAQLPLEDALRITHEVADALSCAHAHGIVHRDIKPENILLGGGHARVADFGIARAYTAAGSESLTETGLVIGTPAYMSPEQASGREVDARSDQYSLGCVLYEMLAGQPPYTGGTPEAILARKSLEPVPSLRVVRDAVPEAVERSLARALARVPADRFATAIQFAEALQDVGPARVRPRRAPRAPRVRRAVAAAIVIATVAALLFLANGGLRSSLGGPAEVPRIESLAVLPLENLSGDAAQDYIAAGMHEALILNLGKLSALHHVTARASVLRYQDTRKTPREIGEELRVDAVITGTVTRSGDSVRVTAHLIPAATEVELWQDEYVRDLQDVLSLQNEIVSDIARKVQLHLSAQDRAGLTSARQVNRQAYEAYLRGRYELNAFTPDGFARGMAWLREAIRLDPLEPLAYAGLAHGYTLMELFSPGTSQDDAVRAKAAALRAVELDSTLAEAHAVLGFVKGSKERENAGAEQSLQRALRLNPNLPEPHIYYSWGLAIFGQPADAIAEMKRAVELDPLSALYTAWLAGLYWEFGRFDEAILEARKALALQPDFPVALGVLGFSHADKGEFAEAIAAHERALARYPNQGHSWVLARTYALSGRLTEARRILATLETGNPVDALHPWLIASAYSAAGDHDKAMNWLEKAYDDRIMFLGNLGRVRAGGFDLRPLRGNPRFEALLRRLNLTY